MYMYNQKKLDNQGFIDDFYCHITARRRITIESYTEFFNSTISS